MVLDEPCDERAIFPIETVSARKAQRIDRAERRMVAAAAFRDVVEETREIEHLGALEAAHDAAAQRKFVGKLRYDEAAQIAHDFENVLVDRVDVIQVVLHLSDDAAHYILARLDRTYEAVREFVERLDRLALERHRPLTLPLAREVLRQEA